MKVRKLICLLSLTILPLAFLSTRAKAQSSDENESTQIVVEIDKSRSDAYSCPQNNNNLRQLKSLIQKKIEAGDHLKEQDLSELYGTRPHNRKERKRGSYVCAFNVGTGIWYNRLSFYCTSNSVCYDQGNENLEPGCFRAYRNPNTGLFEPDENNCDPTHHQPLKITQSIGLTKITGDLGSYALFKLTPGVYAQAVMVGNQIAAFGLVFPGIK